MDIIARFQVNVPTTADFIKQYYDNKDNKYVYSVEYKSDTIYGIDEGPREKDYKESLEEAVADYEIEIIKRVQNLYAGSKFDCPSTNTVAKVYTEDELRNNKLLMDCERVRPNGLINHSLNQPHCFWKQFEKLFIYVMEITHVKRKNKPIYISDFVRGVLEYRKEHKQYFVSVANNIVNLINEVLDGNVVEYRNKFVYLDDRFLELEEV